MRLGNKNTAFVEQKHMVFMAKMTYSNTTKNTFIPYSPDIQAIRRSVIIGVFATKD